MESNFYKEKATVNKYIEMAKGHDGRALIEKLIPHVSSDSKILEIGSGPGVDFEILNKDYEVVGSDYSKEFINRLQRLFPEETFLELDAVSLLTDLTFDAIYSNKVLHHLTDAELAQSIQRQINILNPQGFISHSFWKGNGTENYSGMYVNNHSEEGLERFFSPYFEIVSLEPYQEFEENDSLLLMAKKK